ncbi:DUF4169 family protein [Maricaulis parjimensis]|uniref:DUF4169 family protein n=1 Tax=Maricaulis parjimensis TaxID=144023 RepID=UPI001939BB72|nr:DUF4169 family protein [Maricaulis parjimensis]
MTSKPINLRQYRKRKQREDKAKTAEANRIAHGTPKAVSDLAKARQDLAKKRVEAHRREDKSSPDDGDNQ